MDKQHFEEITYNNCNFEDVFYLNTQDKIKNMHQRHKKIMRNTIGSLSFFYAMYLAIIGMTSIADLLSITCYVFGIGYGIKSSLEFKEHYENKGKLPISNSIIYAIIAALFVALPTVISPANNTDCFEDLHSYSNHYIENSRLSN